MPQAVYLDDQGNPISAAAAPAGKVYLDDNGDPITPTFRTTNETDEAGNPIVRGVGAALAQVNPITAIRSAGEAVMHPVATVKGLGAAQGALFEKAKQSYDKGDYVTAARHFVDYLLPIIGPGLDAQADLMQQGKTAEGIGGSVGLGLAMFGAPMAAKAGAKVSEATRGFVNRPRFVNANPVEAAAVEFGRERGIPIDAATASGKPLVRNVQKAASERLGGASIAEKFKTNQAAQLERVGRDIATDVSPEMATPETAGGAVREGVEGLIRQFHEQANQAYGKLRALEQQHEVTVPAQESPSVQRDIRARMVNTLGSVPSPAELHELRRIRAEMDALPFTKRTWTPAPKKSGNAAGGDYDIKAGAAGAPVYDDILQHAPGTSRPTRGEVIRSLDAALGAGQFTDAAKGALEVARKRLAGDSTVSKPSLPPEAGIGKTTEQMLLPVDMRTTKADSLPIYERLKREAELVPLVGPKAKALTALDRIVNGPDYAPVSEADAALSDLKAMSRGAALPELRNVGQGIAARTVGRLDAAVRAAVAKAGPEATAALQEGRQATAAKYATADVLDQIRAEPVKGYRQLTAPKDTGIALLRQVADSAPQAIPQIGRAVLEELMGKATAEGGFQRAAGLQADWQRLGPDTKALLFKEQAPALDRFFLLAKKIGENPNPSGTAGVLRGWQILNPVEWLWALPNAAITKVLYSPKAIEWLNRGMQLQAGPGRVSKTAQAVAFSNIVRAAREAGVPVPKAADQTTDPAVPAGSGR